MRRTLAAIVLSCLALPAVAATYEGKVGQVDGPVATINGKPATVGQLVKAGDIVRTGAKSHIDLLWGRGRASRLMANSQLLVPQPQAPQQLTLSWGGLLSVLRAKGPFRTSSGNAVAAVTGTVYYHEETKEHPGYVCVCSGTVKIGHPSAPHSHKPVTATNHKAVHAKPTGHQTAPMVNHTDDDIGFLDQYLIHQEEESEP